MTASQDRVWRDVAVHIAADRRTSLAGMDLRGVDLSVAGWPGLCLDGADLRGARLTGARLRGLSLRGAALDGAVLVGADLRDADLSWAGLRGANLSGADLRRADLRYADLRQASLMTADLADAVMQGADLREAMLTAANGPRADLRSADLRWATLGDATLADADLEGARFEGAVLHGADLRGTRITPSTVLSFAFLHGCRLDGTDLRRHHVEDGVGEAFADLCLAAATYREIERLFESRRRRSDADWAHRAAARLETAAHRPDRAPRYFPIPARRTAGPMDADVHPALALYYLRHGARWVAGALADAACGHGTCARRVAAVVLLLWLLSGAVYHGSGGLASADGRAVRWPDALRFSAAAMTPLEPHPLRAATSTVHAVALLQGLVGLVLLGALGYLACARLRDRLVRPAGG